MEITEYYSVKGIWATSFNVACKSASMSSMSHSRRYLKIMTKLPRFNILLSWGVTWAVMPRISRISFVQVQLGKILWKRVKFSLTHIF